MLRRPRCSLNLRRMRNQQGELNNGAVITAAQAAAVKGLYARGVGQAVIAVYVGVTKANVWAIVNRKSWESVPPDLDFPLPPPPEERTHKWCPNCEQSKPLTDFAKSKNRAYKVGAHCRPCKRTITHVASRRLRTRALKRLGGKCACCGESRYEFLAFDHVNGDGSTHRKSVSPRKLVRIVAEGRSSGIQVLCHNCNCARGFYGYCPHSRENIARGDLTPA